MSARCAQLRPSFGIQCTRPESLRVKVAKLCRERRLAQQNGLGAAFHAGVAGLLYPGSWRSIAQGCCTSASPAASRRAHASVPSVQRLPCLPADTCRHTSRAGPTLEASLSCSYVWRMSAWRMSQHVPHGFFFISRPSVPRSGRGGLRVRATVPFGQAIIAAASRKAGALREPRGNGGERKNLMNSDTIVGGYVLILSTP